MKKKRTYNTRLIKSTRSYTVQAIADLYDLHPNAVDRWFKAGLPRIDEKKPQRAHGTELIAFLKAKQSSRKRPCQPNELYCCKCRKSQPAWENTVDLIILNPKRLNITGLCAVCNRPAFRGGAVKKIPEYQKTFNVQTVQGGHLVTCSNPSVMCESERNSEP